MDDDSKIVSVQRKSTRKAYAIRKAEGIRLNELKEMGSVSVSAGWWARICLQKEISPDQGQMKIWNRIRANSSNACDPSQKGCALVRNNRKEHRLVTENLTGGLGDLSALSPRPNPIGVIGLVGKTNDGPLGRYGSKTPPVPGETTLMGNG
uniref:Uncharacterized protein n=1 Tax=Anopheles coluzzii TaxID=1518534 RepID=A0A8W7P8N9_ANOCL